MQTEILQRDMWREGLRISLAALALLAVNFFPFACRDFPHLWIDSSSVAHVAGKGLLHPLDQPWWPLFVLVSWVTWAILFPCLFAVAARRKTLIEGAVFGLLVGALTAVPQTLLDIGLWNIAPRVFVMRLIILWPVAVVDGIVVAAIFRTVLAESTTPTAVVVPEED